MELTDNLLWLLKQAFHFSLTTVNEAVKPHGVSTAHLGVLRQLTQEPGLSGAELARRLLITRRACSWRSPGWSSAAWWSAARIPGTAGFCTPT